MRKLTILFFILIISFSTYSCSKNSATNNSEVIDDNDIIDDDNIEEQDKRDTEKDDTTSDDKGNKEDTSDNETDDDLDNPGEIDVTKGYEEPANLSIEIEGTTEEITASLYHSPLGYKMVYDNELFSLSNKEGSLDSYVAENLEPDKYPDISIRISTLNSSNPIIEFEESQDSITTASGDKANFVEEVKIGAYTAKHYKLKTGDEWDSIIKNFYIIETEGIDFIIETQYFLEAAEGYGARIWAMLNTFEI